MKSPAEIVSASKRIYTLVSAGETISLTMAVFLLGEYAGLLKAPYFIFVPGLLFVVNFLIHNTLLNASQKRPQQFITLFMGITAAKLFFYLIFLVVYILLAGKQYAVEFGIGFMVLYLMYTSTEIVLILQHLKKMDEARNA